MFDSTPLDSDENAKNRIGLAIKDNYNDQSNSYEENNIRHIPLQYVIAGFLLVACILFLVCTYLYCKRKQSQDDENILAY